MQEYYSTVKNYLLELGYQITHEQVEEGIIQIDNVSEGIQNLLMVIAEPILIIEQFIFNLNDANADILKQLLQKNREIVHGAFVLDESGKKVIFRDTLQLENLDLNELEGTINSLSLLLSEYSDNIIQFSKA